MNFAVWGLRLAHLVPSGLVVGLLAFGVFSVASPIRIAILLLSDYHETICDYWHAASVM